MDILRKIIQFQLSFCFCFITTFHIHFSNSASLQKLIYSLLHSPMFIYYSKYNMHEYFYINSLNSAFSLYINHQKPTCHTNCGIFYFIFSTHHFLVQSHQMGLAFCLVGFVRRNIYCMCY